ncbi:hypothetical protein G3M48_001184 [Beauveria asiatica]|uniref:Alpha-galactosidase n=1 Tax=Beauveria asiatica TaxID=1069075 RepID=A0AAW0RZP2_9HYPO
MRYSSISTRSWAGCIAITLTTASVGQAYVMSQGQASKLPTLGWNSWNAYHCDINAEQFLEAAQAIVDRGLRDAGYNYVNIDDCWQVKNGRIDGHIAVNRDKFPDGIDGLAKKIHALNLKMGIYSTAGTTTCAGYPASLEHEDIDAADWASWGIDYLKYDNCNIPPSWQDQYVACDPASTHLGANGTCNSKDEPRLASAGYDWHSSKSYQRFKRMRDALAKQNREIVYNMCIWGTADVFSWGKDLAASWRMSEDIRSNWNSIKSIINQNSFKMHSTNFYGHGDADMLEVGNGLSPAETRTHFALWAAMKSPLLIGSNVKNLTQDDVDILKNSYLLAFNQDDEYGEPAQPYKWGVNPQWTYDAANPAEFWAGASSIGHLVLMMNVRDDKTTKTAIWNEVPGLQSEKYHVTDVWTGKDLGCLSSYSVAVDAHDTAAILVGERC